MTLLVLTSLSFAYPTPKNKTFRINFDYEHRKIHVNSSGHTFSFDENSTLSDYELVFGKAKKHVERGTALYHFEYGQGIILIGKVNSTSIAEFRVSFLENTLGRFNGALYINGKRVKPLYKIEHIKQLAPNIKLSNWTTRWFFATNHKYNIKISYTKAGLNQHIESIKVFFEK